MFWFFLRNALHWFSTTSLSPDSNVEMTKVHEALSYFSKIDIVSNQGMKILRTFYTVKRKKTNNVLSQNNFFKNIWNEYENYLKLYTSLSHITQQNNGAF